MFASVLQYADLRRKRYWHILDHCGIWHAGFSARFTGCASSAGPRRAVAIPALVLFVVLQCVHHPAAADTLRFVGSTTIGNTLAAALAERFLIERLHATGVTTTPLSPRRLSVWVGELPLPGGPGGCAARSRKVVVDPAVPDRVAKDYLHAIGVPPEKIGVTPNFNIPQAVVSGLVNGRQQEISIEPLGSIAGFDFLDVLQYARKAQPGYASDVGVLAMSSTRIPPAVVERLRAAYGDLASPGHEHALARDAVEVIVNADVAGVNSLTIGQVREIYEGTITNWSRVGGPTRDIVRYARDGDSGTAQVFNALVMGGHAPCDPSIAEFANNNLVAAAVSGATGGIGYVGLGSIVPANVQTMAIGDAGLEPVVPHPHTVLNESYRLGRTVYIYSTTQTGTWLSDEFLKFLKEPQHAASVRAAVAAEGLVPLSVSVERTHGAASALSLLFHFNSGSSAVDARLNAEAIDNIDRLITYVHDNAIQWSRVTLVGHADSDGDDTVNCPLSQNRANAVAAYLRTVRGIEVGNIKSRCAREPIASNATGEGKAANRRVQVVVR